MPMPDRLRHTVSGDGCELRDLIDLARHASPALLDEASHALEQHFGGTAKAVLTDSGSSALLLALRHHGIGAGDQVIIASFNCPQVAEAVLATGATPVLADCEPHTGAIEATSVRGLITGYTRCIVLTHQFGVVSPTVGDVLDIAAEHGIATIDDCAQALGARLAGVPAGRLCETGVLSFGRTKPLSCFGGGALLVPNDSHSPFLALSTTDGPARPAGRMVYDRFVRGRSKPVRHALTRLAPLVTLQTDVSEALERQSHVVEEPRRIHPHHARVLIRKLEHFGHTLAARREGARHLARALEGLPLAVPPVEEEGYAASSFCVRLASGVRWELGSLLSRRGFQTSWSHYPLHRQSRYRHHAIGAYPGTEELWPRNLILPYRRLKPHQVAALAGSIREFFG